MECELVREQLVPRFTIDLNLDLRQYEARDLVLFFALSIGNPKGVCVCVLQWILMAAGDTRIPGSVETGRKG